MKSPPLDPPVSDNAPNDAILTRYDQQHLVTYLRLLDAEVEGADWRQVARVVLHIDPDRRRKAIPFGGRFRHPPKSPYLKPPPLRHLDPWQPLSSGCRNLITEAF